MKIQVEVEIFDDPEYCIGHSRENRCEKLDIARHSMQSDMCALFDETIRDYKKCPQCKEAWQRAKKSKTASKMERSAKSNEVVMPVKKMNKEEFEKLYPEKPLNLNEVVNG